MRTRNTFLLIFTFFIHGCGQNIIEPQKDITGTYSSDDGGKRGLTLDPDMSLGIADRGAFAAAPVPL